MRPHRLTNLVQNRLAGGGPVRLDLDDRAEPRAIERRSKGDKLLSMMKNPVYRGIVGVFRNAIVPFLTASCHLSSA